MVCYRNILLLLSNAPFHAMPTILEVICLFRYDSDNPRVHGDVGMAGVAVDSVEDMKVYPVCK